MKVKKDSAMTEAARAMGRKGGTNRAKALSKERRIEIATLAANLRWAMASPKRKT